MPGDFCSNPQPGGAVLWLEPTHLHFHSGGPVEIRTNWGREMKREETAEATCERVTVIDPRGKSSEAGVERDESLQATAIRFRATEEGLYYVLAEGNCCSDKDSRWAGLLVPVGHHIHGSGVKAGAGLEIIPLTFRAYHPGDSLELQVFLNGKPVGNAKVNATYHFFEGNGFARCESADGDGKVSFNLDSKGHWMFQVTVEDVTGNYTGTHVVPGVR